VKKTVNSDQSTVNSAEWTVKDMERSLARRQALEVELDGLINEMERELAEVRGKYGRDMAAIAIKITTEKQLQGPWMVAHKADFDGPPRSIEFACATIGYRLGQEHLKPISKWTWDKVLKKILELGNEDFLRRPPEVDREVILANKDALGTEGLKAIGLKVVQDDNPYVEIKRDQTAEQVATAEGAA